MGADSAGGSYAHGVDAEGFEHGDANSVGEEERLRRGTRERRRLTGWKRATDGFSQLKH